MKMDEPIAEFRRLVRALAKIERLQAQLKRGADPQTLQAVTHLIETETRDYERRARLETQYGLAPAPEWSTQIKNELNATLGRCNDGVSQGNVYVSLGRYVEALAHYHRSPHALLLTSHVNLLQKSYSHVESTVGPVWRAWQRASRSNNGAPSMPPNLSNEVLLNLALAYWCLHEHALCLAVILHIDVAEIKRAQYEHCWLTPSNLQAMLFATARLCLSPTDRHFLHTSDPVAQYFAVSGLISQAETGDLADFWAIVSKLSFPFGCESVTIKSQLRDLVAVEWLQQYSQIPESVTIRELGRGFRELGHSEYARGDLLADIRRYKLPYDLDSVRQCLVLRTGQQQAEISRARMFAVGEDLAMAFKRDSLVATWHQSSQQWPR